MASTALMIGICLALASSVTPTYASKTTSVEATVIFSGPPPTMLPAGDEETHLAGLGKRTGKATVSDGRKAEYSNAFFMDWYRGKSMIETCKGDETAMCSSPFIFLVCPANHSRVKSSLVIQSAHIFFLTLCFFFSITTR